MKAEARYRRATRALDAARQAVRKHDRDSWLASLALREKVDRALAAWVEARVAAGYVIRNDRVVKPDAKSGRKPRRK